MNDEGWRVAKITGDVNVTPPTSGRHIDGHEMPGMRLYATLTDEAIEAVAKKVVELLRTA